MKILSEKQFREKKKTNRLVIYGSGSSINNITSSQLKNLSERDSLSFNWFCKHPSIAPLFFLIREQANIPKRITKTETTEILFEQINKSIYQQTCFIVHDQHSHSPHAFPYQKYLNRIPGDGIVVADTKSGNLLQNIFSNGIYHGSTTLMNALHVAGFLGYEEILFAGVDLNNSRYFWLPDDEERESIRQKGVSVTDPHPVAKNAIDAVRQFKDSFPNVKLRCLNSKSLLRKVMDCERI